MTSYDITFKPDTIAPMKVEAPYLDALVDDILAHARQASNLALDGVTMHEDRTMPDQFLGTGLLLLGEDSPVSYVAQADISQFL